MKPREKLFQKGALEVRLSRYPCGVPRWEGLFECKKCGIARWRGKPLSWAKNIPDLCLSCSGKINCVEAQKPKYKHLGKANPNYKRGYSVSTFGYRIVSLPKEHPCRNWVRDKKGRVFEHRLVMMQHLKRPLEPWEHVHHKDGDKQNNRLENLEIVCPSAHATFTAMQVKIRELESENKELREKLERATIELCQSKLNPSEKVESV